MNANPLFPVFLKLETLRTLLVGGGYVALEKLNAILANSPNAPVTLVAGMIRNEVRAAGMGKNVTYLERNFEYADLDLADLVILATNDPALHAAIRQAARTKRLLVNVADTPHLCDFYLGAVVTKGDLKIAVSTNGKSPTMAKRVRDTLDEALPHSINLLLQNLNAIRNSLKTTFEEKVKILNDLTSAWTAGKNNF
jgi:precorrin-2 dehydrogenase/sirohydrochlorin ferrochelatase